jgi:pimeloyl-ACP methyl ester carboxylesterase
MRGNAFTAAVEGGQITGWVDGAGPPVLLLHGGPGLSYDYLDEVGAELCDGYQVAACQQRGLPPSMLDGPYDVDTHLADIRAVLDALGWSTAYIVGHSWGGHLALHVAVAMPERVSGVLCVDPLGGVGDGGAAIFGAELTARMPAESRERGAELDALEAAGESTAADAIEGLRLVWRGYFADPAAAPPMTYDAISIGSNVGGFESLMARLPELEASLPSITVPLGIVMGAKSPMPTEETGRRTAERIPGAWLEVVEDAGHFPWVERPGCVRSALDRLAAG